MPDVRDETTGAYDLAASAGAVLRNAYTPYGATRSVGFGAGAADEADAQFERTWLSQVADETTATLGTGLTYLNARYYDPVSSRFLSPDPLLDVMDPKTLDPYRYADNNPIVFTDVTGLAPSCEGVTGAAQTYCSIYGGRPHSSGGYRVGTPTRPGWDIDDHNVNAHGSKRANPVDWLMANKAREAATLSLLKYPEWDDAVPMFLHYLDNTGTPARFDFEEAIAEDQLISNWVDGEIERAARNVDELLPIMGSERFSVTGPAWPSRINPSTNNWQRTVGAFDIWSSADVSVSDGTATMVLSIAGEDYYNFNPGASIIDFSLDDDDFARLEEVGLAHGFPSKGEVWRVVSWPVGDPSPGSLSVSPGERNAAEVFEWR